MALWKQIEEKVVPPDWPYQNDDAEWEPRWDDERLLAAKALAKGEIPPTELLLGETSVGYARRILRTKNELNTEVIPVHAAHYESRIKELERRIIVDQDQLGPLTRRPGTQLAGITLRPAFAEYEREIKDKKTYKTPDGKRKPWGQTQLNNLTSITDFYLKDYLELDLGELNTNKCEEMIEVFVARPTTQDAWHTSRSAKVCILPRPY